MSKTALDEECKSQVRSILKVELARRDLKQTDLAQLLDEKYGIKETPQSLSNKINRGAFSAVFMYQVLMAIGCESIAIR